MFNPECNVPLAPLTTLELGGNAEYFARIEGESELTQAFAWAREHELAVTILAGGSNVLVPDQGVRGLVLHVKSQGIEVRERPDLSSDCYEFDLAAGENWDSFVERSVEQGFAGVECLSGIPGTAGGTPIQNVGAYGQEVSQAIASVRVFDPKEAVFRDISASDCNFSYRESRFKQDWSYLFVTRVRFVLKKGLAPSPHYAELARALSQSSPGAERDPRVIRRVVMELRRAKSMVIDPADPNRRSVGSFFTNPIIPSSKATSILERAERVRGTPPPHWLLGESVKLAAAWLIEGAGYRKGQTFGSGSFGISGRHALSLVHHGGGKMTELLEIADEIIGKVHATFGVTLGIEPRILDGA